MKYTFRHTAYIEHEIEAESLMEAKKKLMEEVIESTKFFEQATQVVSDERIKVFNEQGDHVDTFNVYDDI